jgi:hypothetical protein
MPDLCPSQELHSIEWLGALEAGAVPIVEPEADGSLVVTEREPRKPLTPVSREAFRWVDCPLAIRTSSGSTEMGRFRTWRLPHYER